MRFVGLVVALAIAGLSGPYAIVLVRSSSSSSSAARSAADVRDGRAPARRGHPGHCRPRRGIVGGLEETRIQFPGFGVITRDVWAGHISMFLFEVDFVKRLRADAYTFEGLAALVADRVSCSVHSASRSRTSPCLFVAGLLAGAFVIEEMLVNFGSIHNSAGGQLGPRGSDRDLDPCIGVRNDGAGGGDRGCGDRSVRVGVGSGRQFLVGITRGGARRCIDCPNWTAQVDAFAEGGTEEAVHLAGTAARAGTSTTFRRISEAPRPDYRRGDETRPRDAAGGGRRQRHQRRRRGCDHPRVPRQDALARRVPTTPARSRRSGVT